MPNPASVIDPNALWPDGSTSLSQWSPSPDGRLLSYGRSDGGADWETVKVRDVDGGMDLPEELKWVRFSGLSWTRDSKGFFYSRYPEPPKGKVLEAALANQTLYYHRVGTPQAADTLIYARTDLPSWFVSGSATEDGRYSSSGCRRARTTATACITPTCAIRSIRRSGRRSRRSSKKTAWSSRRSGTGAASCSCERIVRPRTGRCWRSI
jgi:prolyl oligopeptidase PreP (S9A serine peptidase family)